MPAASWIRSAYSHDFWVIIRKAVLKLVVKPFDLGLFPPAKYAQLRVDRLQFFACVLMVATGTPMIVVLIGMVQFGDMPQRCEGQIT